MGARLVSLVLARWSHVSDRAFRVLIRMANTALDEATNDRPAGVYFGGHDLLAMTMRRENGGTTDSAVRTARRAVAELVAEGVIERVNRARSGEKQVYRLCLHAARSIDARPPASPETVPIEQDTWCPAEADTSGPAEQDTWCPSSRTPIVLPRNQEEPLDERYQDESFDLDTDVAVAREGSFANKPDFPIDSPPAEPPPATGTPTSPRKCRHGLKIDLRPDGDVRCQFCRREATAPVEPPEPDPPSNGGPPDDPLVTDPLVTDLPVDVPSPVGAGFCPQLRVIPGGLAA